MKVMLLIGSGDPTSHSLGLGNAIANELSSLGVTVELINLVEYGLPLYSRSVERANAYDEITRTFLDTSYDADAFVWVTPIYHNSFSSILKNALDWQHTKFPGKVVGMASHGGDRSTQAMDQLMVVARAQYLVSTRVRVATQEDDYDKGLQLANPDILSRVRDFSQELQDLTTRIGAKGAHIAAGVTP
jgi:azobenzene reductase